MPEAVTEKVERPKEAAAPTQAATALVPQKLQALRDYLWKFRGDFSKVLVAGWTAERMLQVTLAAIGRSDKLQLCTKESLARSLMIAAQLGLDPSGLLGHGWLVPRWNRRFRVYEATFVPGYKGLLELARRSGMVLDGEADVVYEAELREFEFVKGIEPILVHRPYRGDKEAGGKIAGFWAMVRLKDAPPKIVWMRKWEIDETRDRVFRQNGFRPFVDDGPEPSGPWVEFYVPMGMKTALKQALRTAPMSVEIATAITLEDREEIGDRNLSDIVALPAIEEEAAPAALPERPPATATEALAQDLRRQAPPRPAGTFPQEYATAAAAPPKATDKVAQFPIPDGPTPPAPGGEANPPKQTGLEIGPEEQAAIRRREEEQAAKERKR